VNNEELIQAKPKVMTIKVYNTCFDPANITCTVDTTIRWVVVASKENDSKSLYYGSTRGHVIGFDEIDAESSFLDINGYYELTFYRPGIYNYKCLILRNMEGCIEVLPKEEITISREEIVKTKVSRSVYSIGASTDIERIGVEENLELADESIKKVIDKYMTKAKWELPKQLAIEIKKIEKELPFFEEHKKVKAKKRRKRKRKHNRSKRKFMKLWKEQPDLLREVLQIVFEKMQTGVKEKESGVDISRTSIIKDCMDFIP